MVIIFPTPRTVPVSVVLSKFASRIKCPTLRSFSQPHRPCCTAESLADPFQTLGATVAHREILENRCELSAGLCISSRANRQVLARHYYRQSLHAPLRKLMQASASSADNYPSKSHEVRTPRRVKHHDSFPWMWRKLLLHTFSVRLCLPPKRKGRPHEAR